MNPADGPLQWPDYAEPAKEKELLLPTLQQKLQCGMITRRSGHRTTALLQLMGAQSMAERAWPTAEEDRLQDVQRDDPQAMIGSMRARLMAHEAQPMAKET